MFRIVRGIIYRYHRPYPVKVLHEHTFLVEIKNPHRTLDAIHPPLAPPTLHGLQQSRRHVLVVNELDETETDVLRVPFLIRTMVDNADDTPHCISVLVVSDERLDVRKVQPGIFTGVERLTDIRLHIRNIIRTSGIQSFRKSHEIIHFAFRIHFFYIYFPHDRARIYEYFSFQQDRPNSKPPYRTKVEILRTLIRQKTSEKPTLQQKVLGPAGEIKHAKMAVRILTRIAHFKPYPTEIQNNPFTENHPKTKCKTLPSFC